MEKVGSGKRHALTIQWKIENIRFWDRESRDISSSHFCARTLGETLYLKLYSDEEDGSVLFYICKYNYHLNFRIDCEFTFIGSDGSPFIRKIGRYRNFNSYICFELCDFASCQKKRSAFLPHDTLAVRCRIWKSEGELSNDEFISLRSRCEGHAISFLWPIPGFSCLERNQKVATPIMLDSYNGSSEFQLKFSLIGVSLEDASTNLELASVSIHKDLMVSLKVSILDNEQRAMKYVEINDQYFHEDEIRTIKFSEFWRRDQILKKNSNFLSNNVLTLFVEFSGKLLDPIESIEREYYGPSNLCKDLFEFTSTFLDASSLTVEQSLDSPDTFLQVGDSLAILREDFLNLYKEQSMPDFELRSGDTSFPVHRNILSARSPVFKAMFSSSMEESSSKSMNVPDLDVHTLNRMLTFLYGGTVDALEWENALKLYYAADKYQIQSLKRDCCSYFRSNISVRNVVDIVVLADRHQDLDLKSFVHGFILNHFDATVSSPEWAKFLDSEAHLPGKTMHQIYLMKLRASKNENSNA